MMHPFPPNIWERIIEFLSDGKHGRIEIDVSAGRIMQCRILETIKADSDKAA